jgi:hypothetical protein
VRGPRVSCERVVQLRQVGAERVRGLRAGQARRGGGADVGEQAFFHGQLRVRGVACAAVPLVDAAAVGAQQAGRHLGRVGRLQAGDQLELRAQGAVGEVLQRRGGRSRVQAGTGQDPAQVLEHVGAGPGALFPLSQRDCFLRRAGHLEFRETRAVRGGRARGCAVPHRRRDGRQRHAEGAGELVSPARVQLREVQRAALGGACREVRCLRELRELALGGLAAVALLEPRGAGAQVGGDGLAAGGEQAHHLAAALATPSPAPLSPARPEPQERSAPANPARHPGCHHASTLGDLTPRSSTWLWTTRDALLVESGQRHAPPKAACSFQERLVDGPASLCPRTGQRLRQQRQAPRPEHRAALDEDHHGRVGARRQPVEASRRPLRRHGAPTAGSRPAPAPWRAPPPGRRPARLGRCSPGRRPPVNRRERPCCPPA